MARRSAPGRLPAFARVHVGQPVATVSGQPLGTVRELAGNSFLLKTPADELWLSRESIFTSDPQGITLICDSHGLPRYAVDLDGLPPRGRA